MLISPSCSLPAPPRALQQLIERGQLAGDAGGQRDTLAAMLVKAGVKCVAVQVNALYRGAQAQLPAAAPLALSQHHINPAGELYRVQGVLQPE